MKICILAEGSYPYRTGGVSSWIQMLISWMKEHQFIIYAIASRRKEKGQFNYKLPDNVIDVKEVFFDDALGSKVKRTGTLHMSSKEYHAVKRLVSGEDPDWDVVFAFFGRYKNRPLYDLLMCKAFYGIMEEVYSEKYSNLAFTDFFWTVRSMIVPVLYLIMQGVPEADLYHSVSTGYAGIVGSLGKYLYQKPLVLTEHGIYTREREEEIIKADWLKGCFKDIWIEHFYCLSRCAYDTADIVVSLYKRNMEVQVELGCDKKKISIIPNGIQIEKYKNLQQKDPDSDFIDIGAIVRIVPIKDIKTMIQGFVFAKEKEQKMRLFIMGPSDEDPEYYEECRQLIDSVGLEDVVFTGNVNVTDYIGKMDILVLTSISEGQPLVILEGMACSKPFVATDVGSCRDLLQGNGDSFGDAGIVVPVMDYEKIGKALLKLGKDKELRKQMGKNAYKRVCALYTKDLLINSYKSIYNDLRR